jgi:hypothetical protein
MTFSIIVILRTSVFGKDSEVIAKVKGLIGISPRREISEHIRIILRRLRFGFAMMTTHFSSLPSPCLGQFLVVLKMITIHDHDSATLS